MNNLIPQKNIKIFRTKYYCNNVAYIKQIMKLEIFRDGGSYLVKEYYYMKMYHMHLKIYTFYILFLSLSLLLLLEFPKKGISLEKK